MSSGGEEGDTDALHSPGDASKGGGGGIRATRAPCLWCVLYEPSSRRSEDASSKPSGNQYSANTDRRAEVLVPKDENYFYMICQLG